jgi:glutaredoxin
LTACIIGSTVSIAYLHQLLFRMEQHCVACYSVHLINALILTLTAVASIRLLRSRPRPVRGFSKTSRRFLRYGVVAILLAVNTVMTVHTLETRSALAALRSEAGKDLAYYQYLHDRSPAHDLVVSPGDTVVGEPAIAVHQIVCFYKDGCSHCRDAKKRLTEIVRGHDTAVYLVMKNVASITEDRLRDYEVKRVPAVFIDGRRARGWQVTGFLDRYVEDCGC